MDILTAEAAVWMRMTMLTVLMKGVWSDWCGMRTIVLGIQVGDDSVLSWVGITECRIAEVRVVCSLSDQTGLHVT